jgi:hypothetical protein
MNSGFNKILFSTFTIVEVALQAIPILYSICIVSYDEEYKAHYQ